MRIILMIMVALAAGIATAQEATTKQYGDWTLRCAAGQGGGNLCTLRQRVLQGEAGDLVAEVSLNIAQLENQSRVLMVLNTPEGVALNIAPGFIIDGKGFGPNEEAVNLSWRTCLRQLCRAATILTPQQQGAVLAGNVMMMGYRQFQSETPTTFPISLRGVTAGLAALSTQ